jgi:hypothetical protein
MSMLDLREYYQRFPGALKGRYDGNTFDAGFASIRGRYDRVRAGDPLTADDVMAIFEPTLPFVCDWTKPDKADLEKRMADKDAARLIRDLGGRYDLNLIEQILGCFLELSLASLVLHHVYPGKFSMCSHHIASLLYIAGRRKAGTRAEYYLEYCQELKKWGEQFQLTVVETEFALWTWYRLAYYGGKAEQKDHRRKFDRDPWVRQRRAQRIKESLHAAETMDLARFFLDADDHTLGAIIAWREFECRARDLLRNRGDRTVKEVHALHMDDVAALLPPSRSTEYTFADLWKYRNPVMHEDYEIPVEEAKKVVRCVDEFIEDNQRKFRPR